MCRKKNNNVPGQSDADICEYYKQKTIYVNCDHRTSQGEGTIFNPFSVLFENELIIDSHVLLDELSVEQGLAYYNELALMELEIKIIFIQKENFCSINNNLKIKNTL